MGNHYCASNKPKSEKPETSYLFNQNQLTKDFSRNNSSSPISKSFSQIDKTKPKPNKKKTISNNPTELSKTLTFISHTQELSKIYDTNTFFLQTSSLLYSPEYLKLKNEILFTTHIRFSTNDIRILGNKGSICERSAEITEKPSLSKIGTPKMHNGNRDLSSPKEDGSTPHFDKK